MSEEHYKIAKSSLTGFADVVRKMKGTTDSLTPKQIADGILDVTVGSEWVRPAEYPDIDSLCTNLANSTQCAYFTYDLRKAPDYGYMNVYVKTSSGYNVTYERGHIENGAFVSDASISPVKTGSTTGYFSAIPLDSTYGEVQLYRITGTSHITKITFAASDLTSEDDGITSYLQPCVQRAGNLPYLTDITTTGTAYNKSVYGTVFLERDALVPGKLANIKSLSGAWQYCYALRSLDLSKWDTSNWVVTSLASCFNSCHSLEYLDLHYWDTSGWKITTLASCFANCYSLKAINTRGWDTSLWAVTTMANCWQNCYSLQYLDLSNWSKSTWKVSTITYTWSYCTALKSINFSGWNTSNWTVTTMRYAWQYCSNLQSLDLSGWNTGKFNCADTRNAFTALDNLIDFKAPESLGLTTGANASGTPNALSLVTSTGYTMYVNADYGSSHRLTHQSLINIMTRLATIETTQTLTLGAKNLLKLSAQDIAIATTKGWTVA